MPVPSVELTKYIFYETPTDYDSLDIEYKSCRPKRIPNYHNRALCVSLWKLGGGGGIHVTVYTATLKNNLYSTHKPAKRKKESAKTICQFSLADLPLHYLLAWRKHRGGEYSYVVITWNSRISWEIGWWGRRERCFLHVGYFLHAYTVKKG